MKQEPANRRHFRLAGLPLKARLWAGLALVALTIMGVIEYLETDTLSTGMESGRLFVFTLMGYANLLLIGSTALYISHLWFTSDAVGRWASRLAATGALISLTALSWRWIEVHYLHRPGHVPLSSLYEMMAAFSAVTVLIYLAMERVYRTRSAGAFVMLIVLAAVLFQIWLEGYEHALASSPGRVLRSYWMHAHVLGTFIGYGAFAVAGAMGGAYLIKAQMRDRIFGVATRSLPNLERIDNLMHHAILLGLPIFTVATVLGALWAHRAWGRYWAWDPKETWALLVWLTYASYFYFRYMHKWSGRRMAWWAVIGFGITAFCFLGTRALPPGLHAFRQLLG